jgi:hypothetical protein
MPVQQSHILSMVLLARVTLEQRWRRLGFEAQIAVLALASMVIVVGLLLMLDLRPHPSTELPAIIVTPPAEEDFDIAWRDAAVPIALLSASLTMYQTPKTDRAPLPVEAPPVLEPVVVQASVAEPEPEQLAEPPVRRRHETNVCTRHHMHKVITRGGKSWRCRR